MSTLEFDLFDPDSLLAPRLKILREFLQGLRYDQFYVQFEDNLVTVREATGLPTCQSVDKKTFKEHCQGKEVVAAFDSRSKKHRLIIPCTPSSHMACFVRSASARTFNNLIRRVAQEATTKRRAFTEGHDVAWLHVKIPL